MWDDLPLFITNMEQMLTATFTAVNVADTEFLEK